MKSSWSPRIERARLPGLLLLLGCALACSSVEDPAGPSADAARTGAAEPTRGGTAVLGSVTDVDAWNEYLSRQTFAVGLLRRVYLGLAQELGDSAQHPPTYAPLLAERWEWSDDGLELTFHLREASWSDGEPVDAGDVRYTWLAQTSEHVPWIGAASKRHIRDVEALGPRTVRFVFDRVYPQQLGDAVLGGIVPEHVFGAIPFEEWPTYDWSTVRVASGPFVLADHRPGESITLERNPRYHRPELPRLDRVVVRIVPDVTSLLTQLRSGEVDYVENLTPELAASLDKGGAIELVPFAYPNIEYIGWNGAEAPFDDPRVRRALTLAIDRQALVEDLLYDYGRVSGGPLLSSWWSADHDLEPLPYDPDQARTILAELGFEVRNADGGKGGGDRVLELDLLTNAGNRLRESMLVKVQEQLSRVGVVARVHPVEMRALGRSVVTSDFDGYLMGSVYSLQDLPSIFDSRQAPPDGANYVRYRSDEVDRLLEALDRAQRWEDTEPTLHELQRRIREDQPYTYLYESVRIAAHGPRLNGVEIDIPADPLARLEHYWVDTR
jgi:peptide/nickel transport system substrate-binding protein